MATNKTQDKTQDNQELQATTAVKKRGRGGRYNFPTTIDPDTVEPGTNTAYLTHALAVQNMPRIDVKDPEQVRSRIQEYFLLCAEHDMKPSVKGFQNALKIPSSTMWEWKQGNYRAGTHQAIILEAYDTLEALWQDYMQNGKINPVSGIFLGKNLFGYADQKEVVLTPNNRPQDADPETIAQKYAELPEV